MDNLCSIGFNDNKCVQCVNLQTAYINKVKMIYSVKMYLEKLKKYLESNEKDTLLLLNSLEEWKMLLEMLNDGEEEHETVDKSLSTITEEFRNSFELNSSGTTVDNFKNEEDVHGREEEKTTSASLCYGDYVYNENYGMYYSQSTGYYYDENKGLLYDPRTCSYYKYDYEEKKYESVKIEEFTDTITSQNICETVVHQVNNLNLNDNNDDKHTDKQPESFSEVSTTAANANENISSVNHKEDSTDILPEKTDDLVGSTKDWKSENGSNMTIKDLVKQVVEECMETSDYVYDEKSKMYYSSATGYYYDSVRNLLYDPYSQIYYFYDPAKETYEFYCQAESATSVENEERKCGIDEKKMKLRKQYWKKKMKQLRTENVSPDSNDKAEDSDEEFSSPEDGEVFSSDDDTEPSVCISKSAVKSCDVSTVKHCDNLYPPSIRAIVKHSEKLNIGSLVLITCTGGIIGRDPESVIHLPDISVSKIHAEVTYCSKTNKYHVKDLGSQNGTFVNEQRLSEPKEKSKPYELNHGDELSLGSCKLLLHIHDGYETCDDCEPGQILAKMSSENEKSLIPLSREEKESARREQLHRIKKKYGITGFNCNLMSSSKSNKYEDKAKIRRDTVGSDNPYEKTEESSLESSISETNKGYQMLKKMGWKEGQGLGTSDLAITEPIPLRPWTSKGGLGSSHFDVGDDFAVKDKRKMKWIKAQERYQQIS